MVVGANDARHIPLKPVSIVQNRSRYEEDAASGIEPSRAGVGMLLLGEQQMGCVQDTRSRVKVSFLPPI
jgi:hypothetical protein